MLFLSAVTQQCSGSHCHFHNRRSDVSATPEVKQMENKSDQVVTQRVDIRVDRSSRRRSETGTFLPESRVQMQAEKAEVGEAVCVRDKPSQA